MSNQERLRIPFGGILRSGRFYVPPEWPLHVENGLPVIIVMGGDWSDVMIDRTTSFREPSNPLGPAIVIYPDPVVATSENGKFWGGFTGPRDSDFIRPDEAGFLAELLRIVRTSLLARANERRAAFGLPALGDVLDGRVYLVGYSAGAILSNELATMFNPLVDAEGYAYTFAAMAVYAMTVGGYRRGDEIDLLPNQHPPLFDPALYPAMDVLIVHGAEDEQVASRKPQDPIVDIDSDATGSNNLVVSKTSLERFLLGVPGSLEYAPTFARNLARWDYEVEFGTDGWAAGLGVTLAALPDVDLAPYDLTGSAVGLTGTRREGVSAGRLVELIIDGLEHGWPTDIVDLERLFVDFFTGTFGPP